MKNTGMTRPVDDLGRICLPKELRGVLEIKEHDRMAIYVDCDRIILQKQNPDKTKCCFCGRTDGLKTIYEGTLCQSCVELIGKLNG